MDISDFRTDIIESISETCTSTEDCEEAYLYEVVNILYECNISTGFEPLHFEGLGLNNRKIEIDGYYFDETDNTLSIFLCRYSGDSVPGHVTRADIEKLYSRCRNFITEVFGGNLYDKCANDLQKHAIERMYKVRTDIERYNFFLITDDVRGEREIKELDTEDIDNKPTRVYLIDIREFYNLTTSKSINEGTEISFENYGYDGIQCIKAEGHSAEYDAYLCIMPGRLLSSIYSKYGSRLLEANVRSFLGAKREANKGIKNTINTEPSRFFAYNNGISATATGVKTERSENGLKITSISSFQIVNGGQTTAMINMIERTRKDADIDSVFVPMKIIVVQENTAAEITQNISQYSNTQNAVKKEDFFSNSPFHIKFEIISRRMTALPSAGSVNSTRWYYERARGSYLQEQAMLTPAKKKEFLKTNPKSQCIVKTDLAKYWNTYHMKPWIVSKGTNHSIREYSEEVVTLWGEKSDSGREGVRVNDNYFKDSVAIAILYKDLEKSISNKELAPWYNSGYRANLVTYSISKLVSMLRDKGYSLNLGRIWTEQVVPNSLRMQLLDIAERVLETITNPNNPIGDVREWCKREACWRSIKTKEMELHKDISSYVISSRIESGQQRRSARDEKVRTGDMVRIDVVEKGGKFWKDLHDWGAEHGELSRDEKTVLQGAFYINEGRLPDVKNSMRIWNIYEKLKASGYGVGKDQ